MVYRVDISKYTSKTKKNDVWQYKKTKHIWKVIQLKEPRTCMHQRNLYLTKKRTFKLEQMHCITS